MPITLKDIIALTKELPEECFEETYERLREIKEKAEVEKKAEAKACVRCGSVNIVRNGKKNKKQAYMTSRDGSFSDITTVKSQNLLTI
jgi:predicted nucleic acid-binding protein